MVFVVFSFVASQFCVPGLLCTHLGHVLTCNLTDNADILRCSCDFCKQANGILFRFGFCDPIVQTRLLLIITVCLCLAVVCGLLIVVKLNT